jgi:hypothetical protein
MKKLVATFVLVAFALLAAGCGQPKTIDGVTYDTYGFINADTKKNPKIRYEVSTGNVIWSILLGAGLIAPVYFIGFSLYNPIGLNNDNTFVPGRI